MGKVEKGGEVGSSSVGSSRCFSFRFSRGRESQRGETTVRRERVRGESNWVLITCVSPHFNFLILFHVLECRNHPPFHDIKYFNFLQMAWDGLGGVSYDFEIKPTNTVSCKLSRI